VQRLRALFLSISRLALAPLYFSLNYKTNLIKRVKKEEVAKAFKKW
jgi:hypothetical protein